jgi:hypothetical protein
MTEIITLKKWDKLTRHQKALLISFIDSLLKKQAKFISENGFDNSTCVKGTELYNPYIATEHDKSYHT